MMEHILPIGTVVLLKGAIKKLVIIGILQKAADSGQQYDYMGVLYPEGFLKPEMTFLFNHDDITDVIFRGYENPERKELMEKVERAYAVEPPSAQ